MSNLTLHTQNSTHFNSSIITAKNVQTMSSKDLLEVINQVRESFGESKIRLNDFNNRIADELENDNYESFVVQNFNNTESIVYDLTIDQCMLIGMRESKGVRKNVLAVLKEKQKPFDITNPAHLLQAIEIQAKQNIALTQELSIAAPKAQALDVLSNSHGTETVDNCAHAMGIQPRKTLRPWMEKNNWIHKDKDGQWRAKSDRIMAGHLKEASRVITDTSGKPRHKVTVYVTPKGKALLTTRLIQAGIIKGVAA